MNFAILLSGGTGQRLGSAIPKQYIVCNGKPIIQYALTTILENKNINEVIIVAAKEWRPTISSIIDTLNSTKPVRFTDSGATRQLSIYNGLCAISKVYNVANDDDLVLIHDAARPLVSAQLLDACLAIEENFDGTLPVVPVKDTVYESKDGTSISSLLDRSTLFAGQAPESFRLKKYVDAHERLGEQALRQINGSSEIAFKAGMRIKLIKGETSNFKITDSNDLEYFKRVIQ